MRRENQLPNYMGCWSAAQYTTIILALVQFNISKINALLSKFNVFIISNLLNHMSQTKATKNFYHMFLSTFPWFPWYIVYFKVHESFLIFNKFLISLAKLICVLQYDLYYACYCIILNNSHLHIIRFELSYFDFSAFASRMLL